MQSARAFLPSAVLCNKRERLEVLKAVAKQAAHTSTHSLPNLDSLKSQQAELQKRRTPNCKRPEGVLLRKFCHTSRSRRTKALTLLYCELRLIIRSLHLGVCNYNHRISSLQDLQRQCPSRRVLLAAPDTCWVSGKSQGHSVSQAGATLHTRKFPEKSHCPLNQHWQHPTILPCNCSKPGCSVRLQANLGTTSHYHGAGYLKIASLQLPIGHG